MSEVTESSLGLPIFNFADKYRKKLSFQKSSFSGDNAIWLGVHLPDRQESYSCRYFHLTRDQVAELIPLLQHFADTGELPQIPQPEPKQ